MPARLFVSIVVCVVIALALLHLRQQRYAMMNEMVRLHEQIDSQRQTMWDDQVRIAEHSSPQGLRQALEHVNLDLETITPTQGRPRPASLASADDARFEATGDRLSLATTTTTLTPTERHQ